MNEQQVQEQLGAQTGVERADTIHFVRVSIERQAWWTRKAAGTPWQHDGLTAGTGR